MTEYIEMTLKYMSAGELKEFNRYLNSKDIEQRYSWDEMLLNEAKSNRNLKLEFLSSLNEFEYGIPEPEYETLAKIHEHMEDILKYNHSSGVSEYMVFCSVINSLMNDNTKVVSLIDIYLDKQLLDNNLYTYDTATFTYGNYAEDAVRKNDFVMAMKNKDVNSASDKQLIEKMNRELRNEYLDEYTMLEEDIKINSTILYEDSKLSIYKYLLETDGIDEDVKYNEFLDNWFNNSFLRDLMLQNLYDAAQKDFGAAIGADRY